MKTQYLPLAEYSSKYKVSISTLRRRIKADDISYVFEDGKYLIQDGAMSTHQRVLRPSPRNSDATLVGAHHESATSAEESSFMATATGSIITESAPMFGAMSFQRTSFQASSEEAALAGANRLLTELKKAYSQILHEKEEQILHLKEELLDLRTLARVLETENDRLSRIQKS